MPLIRINPLLRSLSLSFFALIFLPFGSAQVYNNDFSRLQKLSTYKENKVWMVYGWSFFYPKGVQEKKGKKTSFERFDRSGNRTEEVYYDSKGNANYTCQFIYDESGNEIKKMGGAGDEIVYDKWIYTPIENGRKVERRSEFKKGKESKWVSAFDDSHNMTEEAYYDATGSFAYKWEYSYDAKQNATEKREIDPYGNVYQRWVYKYDDKGNNIDMHHYVSNNQLYRHYDMKYDKKGNMKSKFIFDKDEKLLELTVFVYQFYEGLHAPKNLGNKQ